MISFLREYFSGSATVIWMSLFPITYLIHIAEEYFCGGGYSAYLFSERGVELSPQRFLALQTLGVVLMLIGATLALTLGFPMTMITILAAISSGNGLVHSVRSLRLRGYEPGLFTSVIVWIPLGLGTLARVWETMSVSRFAFASTVGLAITVLVEVIALRGGRLVNSSEHA